MAPHYDVIFQQVSNWDDDHRVIRYLVPRHLTARWSDADFDPITAGRAIEFHDSAWWAVTYQPCSRDHPPRLASR